MFLFRLFTILCPGDILCDVQCFLFDKKKKMKKNSNLDNSTKIMWHFAANFINARAGALRWKIKLWWPYIEILHHS